MNTQEFKKTALSFFPQALLDYYKDDNQYGFNNEIAKTINILGYSVNLTASLIAEAADKNVDLILTHHNIWEDHFRMRDDCLNLLKNYNIVHFFNHLPLDAMPFGPTGALTELLDIKVKKRIFKEGDYFFGLTGCLQNPLSLSAFSRKLEGVLRHKVRFWKNNNKQVKKIGIVAGSGRNLQALHDAYINGCDTYVTGEKSLSSLLYAEHVGLNYVLGSHTFTELPGIKNYARLIGIHYNELSILELNERFME